MLYLSTYFTICVGQNYSNRKDLHDHKLKVDCNIKYKNYFSTTNQKFIQKLNRNKT